MVYKSVRMKICKIDEDMHEIYRGIFVNQVLRMFRTRFGDF